MPNATCTGFIVTTQYHGQPKKADFCMKSLLNMARLDHIFLNALSQEMNKNKLLHVPTVFIIYFPLRNVKIGHKLIEKKI